ncbi:MAG: PIG-L family deacetylase [Acidimicrobiia bacterium]
MATIVSFHAHPDDETIVTGGTMALASDGGHRVVAVFATRGELGEVGEGVLDESEALGDRRVVETQRSADVLGVQRIEFLGYLDSGMAGEATNHADGAFAAADVDEAAERLAAILRAEQADVLTIYDEHGNYGHPDHIQVHDVGMRAAELAGTERVYQATVSRQHFVRVAEENPDTMPDDTPDAEELDLGVDESLITTVVDVQSVLDRKRAAMAAHASQITPESFFLAMPDDIFAKTFGTEWFIRVGHDPADRETWIL